MISLVTAVFTNLRILIIILINLRIGRELHKKIVKELEVGDMIEFFNRVPMGRIMNRLSKDIINIDMSIAMIISGTLSQIGSILFCLAFFVKYVDIYILIPITFFVFLIILLIVFFLKTYREVIRLEAISRSPIC